MKYLWTFVFRKKKNIVDYTEKWTGTQVFGLLKVFSACFHFSIADSNGINVNQLCACNEPDLSTKMDGI